MLLDNVPYRMAA